jgi:hypothetical protein
MDIDVGLALVLFDSVLREESLVSVVNGKSSLSLVRQQFADIFQSCGLENLGEQEFVVSFDVVIRILCEGILGVIASQKLSRSVQFNSEGCVVFMQNVEEFLQSGEKLPWVFTWLMGQIGQSIDDELIVRCGCKLPFEERANLSPGFLSHHEFEVANCRRKPFFCLASETKSKVHKCHCVIPVI